MPKKKGDKGGNPSPSQTPEFIAGQIARTDNDPYKDVPLTKNLQVRIYEPVANALDQMESKARVVWLRRVITDAAVEELGVNMFSSSEDHKPQA